MKIKNSTEWKSELVPVVLYIANDGEKFKSESEALEHENKVKTFNTRYKVKKINLSCIPKERTCEAIFVDELTEACIKELEFHYKYMNFFDVFGFNKGNSFGEGWNIISMRSDNYLGQKQCYVHNPYKMIENQKKDIKELENLLSGEIKI